MAEVKISASLLETKLSAAQSEAYSVRCDKDQCIAEHAQEKDRLQAALDAAIQERVRRDAKWQAEFEQLRTVNSG